ASRPTTRWTRLRHRAPASGTPPSRPREACGVRTASGQHGSRRGQRGGACASAVHLRLLAILPSGGTPVPFTVDDFGDLLRLLDQHPEWRSELRRHVLTDELLELPALMRQLGERVDRLAQTQERTAEQLSALTARVDALTEAQARTEARVDALAAAQARIEARLEELAAAQARTEARLEELAAAQVRTA